MHSDEVQTGSFFSSLTWVSLKTHGRPHVWDDNPFSESQFRTLQQFCRSSRTALGASRTVALSVRVFYGGITKSIVTLASAC